MQQLFTALLGPMFAKEMIEISRRRWYFVNRVLYGSVLLGAMFVVWESNWYRWSYNFSIYAAAAIASELFIAISCVQYGAVFLFVPVFVAGVIANERETHSLDLLLTTQLSDREIVVGKLGSRLAVTGLLVLCTLPVVSLIGLFGGVAPGAVVRMQSATLLAMLYCGAHAVYFSTTTRSPMGALVRTYWWMALWILALPMIVGITTFGVLRGSRAAEQIVLPLLVAINPGGSFLSAAVPEVHGDLIKWVGPWYFPALLVVPGAWSVLVIVLAVKQLRQTPAASKNRLGKLLRAITSTSSPREFGDRAATADVPPAAVRAWRAERGLGAFRIANPFWLRSRLARVYDRDGHIGRIQWAGWWLSAGFLLLVTLAESHAWNDDEFAVAFLTPVWIGVAALTAIVAASGLVGDRRRGFFELALVTDLSPAEIVLGSIGAVWEHVKLAYYLAWALSGLFMLTGTATVPGLLFSVVTATLNCWLLLVMGTLCSLAARTVSAALMVTFALPVVMVFGVPLAMIFRKGAGPTVWLTSVVLLIAAIAWARRSTAVAAVGSLLIAVHLGLVTLATCWTHMHMGQDEYPVIVMNPAIMSVISLFRPDYNRLPDPSLLYPLYWSAIVISGALGIAWMVVRFDTLVDRSLAKSDRVVDTDLPGEPIAPTREAALGAVAE